MQFTKEIWENPEYYLLNKYGFPHGKDLILYWLKGTYSKDNKHGQVSSSQDMLEKILPHKNNKKISERIYKS